MTQAMMTTSDESTATALERVLIKGDLSKLTDEQCVFYYKAVCESAGLNPLTRPFEYLVLNGKKVLYARKDCTDQLRSIHDVSVTITSREAMHDCYVVTARATLPTGRTDESIGAVSLGTLKGDNLANALMKAETKSKRRVTLSICGLGLLDETEIETIPEAIKGEPVALPAIPIRASSAYEKGKDSNVHIVGELVRDLIKAGIPATTVQAKMKHITGCEKRAELNDGQAIAVIEEFEQWLDVLDDPAVGVGR